MGANKELNVRKCGEILMHIKNINKKNKMYTFHCAFCDADCDQLKKFSIHLEQQHFQHFTDELQETKEILEPEIKLEENIDSEETQSLNNVLSTKSNDGNTDPLESVETETTTGKPSKDIKQEIELKEDRQEEFENVDVINDTNYDSSMEESDVEEPAKCSVQKKSPAKEYKENESDESSADDDAKDADFEIEKELNTTRRHKKRKIKHVDNEQLSILIQLYKKYDLLWQVNNIAFGIPIKREEEIKKIIEELKENHNVEKTLDDIQEQISYINRLYSKDKEQELKCELEKVEFKPLFEGYKELSFLSESQGPFKCLICNDIIKKFEHYHIHVAKHNDTLPFKCSLCDKAFDKFNNFVLHNKRHLGVHSFHCNVCGKGYPFKAELDWHLTSHTGDKPYLCQICGAGFRSRHGYDNHIRRHEKRFRYECHICKHGFNHLHRLNSHVKSHLNIRDILCNVCGKGFTARKYLLRHKLIHDDEKRYKCRDCGKAFAQDSGLRAHRKQHQPYSTLAENKNNLVQSFLNI